MTNKKQKYYCAWHPKKGMDLRTICESEVACKHEAIYHIAGDSIINPLKHLESQGWQVKEVEIVEKYSEGKYGCIDDYLKECFPELYKLKEATDDKD